MSEQSTETETVETVEETPTVEATEEVEEVEDPPEEEPETFPRAYVEKLRREAADHRGRAADRDALAERLHGSLVAATGRLADPSDLPYDAEHLEDPEALTAAVDDLLARKPHLASRKVSGDVGQGATGGSEAVDLAGMLRALA